MHLPRQLAQVDPIVASFCGGAVGVLSTLMVVEMNNAKKQAQARCVYCGVRCHLSLPKPVGPSVGACPNVHPLASDLSWQMQKAPVQLLLHAAQVMVVKPWVHD